MLCPVAAPGWVPGPGGFRFEVGHPLPGTRSWWVTRHGWSPAGVPGAPGRPGAPPGTRLTPVTFPRWVPTTHHRLGYGLAQVTTTRRVITRRGHATHTPVTLITQLPRVSVEPGRGHPHPGAKRRKVAGGRYPTPPPTSSPHHTRMVPTRTALFVSAVCPCPLLGSPIMRPGMPLVYLSPTVHPTGTHPKRECYCMQ